MARLHSSRGTLLLVLIAMITSSRNTNKKYVRSEPVDFCNLGNALQTLTVEDISVPPIQTFPHQRPMAVLNSRERSLLGSGAHREIHSVMNVQLEIDAPDLSEDDSCELIVLEHLPSGAFADPFQLHRLQQLGAVKEVHVYGDVDLERSAKNSFKSIVELHQRLVPPRNDFSEGMFRSEVALPVHARYPPSSPESHFVLNITMPHILVLCRDVTEMSTNLTHDLCIHALWGDQVSATAAQTLQWSIPSGYPGHSTWVAVITTSVALVGVGAISVASRLAVCKSEGRPG